MSGHPTFGSNVIDVILILLGLGLIVLFVMIRLRKALFAGMFTKLEAPKNEEDLLYTPMEEGDICPCGRGILELELVLSNPEEVRLGKYILVCSSCKRKIRSD